MSDDLNHEVLARKANTVLAGLTSGGLMNPMQSDQFFEQAMEESTLLGAIRVEGIEGNKMLIDKIGIGTRMLEKGVEVTDPVNTTAPTTGKVTIDCNEVVGRMFVSYRWLEANIEKEDAADRLMGLIIKRAAVDIEELIWLANTGSGDTYLTTLGSGGLLQQSTTNLVDGLAAPVDKVLFGKMVRKVPKRFKRDLPNMRFFISHNNEAYYREQLGDRQTALGDAAVTEDKPVRAYGRELLRQTWCPETKVLLTNPQNIILGYARRVRIEAERDIDKRAYKIVVSAVLDVKYEEEEAVIQAFNVAEAA